MRTSEEAALGRVLAISREAYSAVKNGETELNQVALLDALSAIIYGNDQICRKLVSGETDKACSMADAMKSYPGFLYGEFEALTPAQFYELVFGYYPKIYDEPFMEQMKELFN